MSTFGQSTTERLWAKYGVEPRACPDCKRDPAPVDEGPMDDPQQAAYDHKPPTMALYCTGCMEILATRYGYGKGAWPKVGV